MSNDTDRKQWPVRFFLNRSGGMKLYTYPVCEAVYSTLEAMVKSPVNYQVQIVYFDSDVEMATKKPVGPEKAMELLDPNAYLCRGKADIPVLLERVKQMCLEDRERIAGEKKSVNFFIGVSGDQWQSLWNDHSLDHCTETWYVHVGPEMDRKQQGIRMVPLCGDLTKYMTGAVVEAVAEKKLPIKAWTPERTSEDLSPEKVAAQIRKILEIK